MQQLLNTNLVLTLKTYHFQIIHLRIVMGFFLTQE